MKREGSNEDYHAPIQVQFSWRKRIQETTSQEYNASHRAEPCQKDTKQVFPVFSFHPLIQSPPQAVTLWWHLWDGVFTVFSILDPDKTVKIRFSTNQSTILSLRFRKMQAAGQ